MAVFDPRSAGLAASDDGRWLAWAEAGRLRVCELARPAQVIELELPLEPPLELAIASGEPERVVVLQAHGGSTRLRVCALPALRDVVEADPPLRGEAQLAALCGSVALLRGGGDSLTAIDLTKLRATPLPVRGPIQLVMRLSSDHVLVGARGTLEAWSVQERRPTHRFGVALPRDAVSGGVIANGRLLWMVASGAPDTVSVVRLADGKKLDVSVGGAIRAVAATAASTTVVVAVHPDPATPLQLVVVDLETQALRPLAFEYPIRGFCLTGAGGDTVAIRPEHGSPVLLSLAAVGAPPRSVVGAPEPEPLDTPDASPAAAREPAPDDLSARLDRWRSQVHAAIVAAPPRPAAVERGGRGTTAEPRSRSRAELYAWGQLARSRSTTTPPPPPQGWRLTDLAVRFQIDMRSKSLLALLYASWLDGEGDRGVPVGVLARALGNDEDAWIESLAQGRLGQLGWLRSRRGRTRLRGVVGRFLDEAPPRVTLVAPAADAVPAVVRVPPLGVVRWELPAGADLAAQVSGLADALNAPVARIDLAALPAERREAVLVARLLEARLHGALPVIAPAGAAPLDPRVLDGPALVVVGDPVPPEWRSLPAWPDADEPARADPPAEDAPG